MVGSLYGVEKMVNFDFVTDQTRKAVKYTKYAFFKESDCSSKSIYEVLGCNGMEAGASLDLMSQEESSVLFFTDV